MATLPCVPGFVNAATRSGLVPAFFGTLYGDAWFMGLATILYHSRMRARATPAPPELEGATT